MARRLPARVVTPLLSLPLVAITAWVAHGVLAPSSTHTAGEPVAPGTAAPSPRLAGLAQPNLDLPADRLEDRVDGGADALRADGCRRLLYWRFETPPAEAEALVFRTADGARTVLAREAGGERTPGPGDEAQLSPQAAYFRRGAVYVRIFLDPGVTAASELARRAEELDRALAQSEPL
jgi:hypothetical protein